MNSLRATQDDPFRAKPSMREKRKQPSSIGVALFIKLDSCMEIIPKQSDMAMCQAEEAERNLFRFYDKRTKQQ